MLRLSLCREIAILLSNRRKSVPSFSPVKKKEIIKQIKIKTMDSFFNKLFKEENQETTSNPILGGVIIIALIAFLFIKTFIA